MKRKPLKVWLKANPYFSEYIGVYFSKYEQVARACLLRKHAKCIWPRLPKHNTNECIPATVTGTIRRKS